MSFTKSPAGRSAGLDDLAADIFAALVIYVFAWNLHDDVQVDVIALSHRPAQLRRLSRGSSFTPLRVRTQYHPDQANQRRQPKSLL